MKFEGDVLMSKEVMHLLKYINRDFEIYLKSQMKSQKIPIKVQHADLFVILYERDERIEFKDLVKAWNRSKSTLSETVNRYVEKGILKKETTPVDKRLVYISLTETGKSYSEGFKNIYKNYSSGLMKSIGDTEKEVFKSVLTEIVEEFER